ncbi:amino acid permease [soil metagenome]
MSASLLPPENPATLRQVAAPDPAAVEPKKALTTLDAMAMIIGIVVGAGIFKTPSLVAANAGSELGVILLWCAGGVISLIGALCYAELTTAYPNAGGDYHFLKRAFGYSPAFLFAWARVMVIQTGSVAMMAFIIGDYLTEVYALGPYSSSIYAMAGVVLLTALNSAGIREGKWTQNLLSLTIVVGLLMVVGAGLFFGSAQVAERLPVTGGGGALGMAMIFVLLTYGGWNEAAYLSAEVRGGAGRRRQMVTALVAGIVLITFIYLAANIAFLRGLGLGGMAGSEVVAADLMRRVMGDTGAGLISLLIAVAALSTMNVTIITGARSTYALGKDYPMFAFLGRWRQQASTPANALLVQGLIALGLVFLGTFARSGFKVMVEYTAPVFWFFFLLVGISLFVLRRKEPETPRPFRVPLYPITPILFCLVCIYMLRSSLAYTGIGALIGVGVLLAGLPVLFLARRGRLVSLKQNQI